jgi:hypothetical protein
MHGVIHDAKVVECEDHWNKKKEQSLCRGNQAAQPTIQLPVYLQLTQLLRFTLKFSAEHLDRLRKNQNMHLQQICYLP